MPRLFEFEVNISVFDGKCVRLLHFGKGSENSYFINLSKLKSCLMKNLIHLAILTVLMASCASEPEYDLKGTLSGVEDGTIFLQKRISRKMEKIDSAAIVNGVFEFVKGAVDYPDV